MEIVFILVETETSANIGSAARALKTMGFNKLRLAAPKCNHQEGKARALAHQSKDILDTAEIFEDLETALHDIDFSIACTARHRKRKRHYIDSNLLFSHLDEKRALFKKIAIVFGGETSGLNAKDIDRCDLLTTIPLATTKPSLNLAQAVMIYSYSLSAFSDKTTLQTKDHRIEEADFSEFQYQLLLGKIKETLDLMKIPNPRPIFRNISYAMARMGKDDLFLVQEIRKRITDRLSSLESRDD